MPAPGGQQVLCSLEDDELAARLTICVHERLGGGGGGRVYKAIFDGQPACVKVLHPHAAKRAKNVEQFLQEANLLATQNHSNLARCLALAHLPPAFCGLPIRGWSWGMVLELAELGSLSSAILKSQQCVEAAPTSQQESNPASTTMPEATKSVTFAPQQAPESSHAYSDLVAVGWCLDIARALQYLHELEPAIIHRDVKPDNVLLYSTQPAQEELAYEHSVAKLTDFGLHVVLDSSPPPQSLPYHHQNSMSIAASHDQTPILINNLNGLRQVSSHSSLHQQQPGKGLGLAHPTASQLQQMLVTPLVSVGGASDMSLQEDGLGPGRISSVASSLALRLNSLLVVQQGIPGSQDQQDADPSASPRAQRNPSTQNLTDLQPGSPARPGANSPRRGPPSTDRLASPLYSQAHQPRASAGSLGPHRGVPGRSASWAVIPHPPQHLDHMPGDLPDAQLTSMPVSPGTGRSKSQVAVLEHLQTVRPAMAGKSWVGEATSSPGISPSVLFNGMLESQETLPSMFPPHPPTPTPQLPGSMLNSATVRTASTTHPSLGGPAMPGGSAGGAAGRVQVSHNQSRMSLTGKGEILSSQLSVNAIRPKDPQPGSTRNSLLSRVSALNSSTTSNMNSITPIGPSPVSTGGDITETRAELNGLPRGENADLVPGQDNIMLTFSGEVEPDVVGARLTSPGSRVGRLISSTQVANASGSTKRTRQPRSNPTSFSNSPLGPVRTGSMAEPERGGPSGLSQEHSLPTRMSITPDYPPTAVFSSQSSLSTEGLVPAGRGSEAGHIDTRNALRSPPPGHVMMPSRQAHSTANDGAGPHLPRHSGPYVASGTEAGMVSGEGVVVLPRFASDRGAAIKAASRLLAGSVGSSYSVSSAPRRAGSHITAVTPGHMQGLASMGESSASLIMGRNLDSLTSARGSNDRLSETSGWGNGTEPGFAAGTGWGVSAAGTALYVAPELTQDAPCSEKADVYAFAILLYEVFSRSMLLSGRTRAEVEFLSARIQAGYRPRRAERIQRDDVWQLIQACWSHEPKRRPDMRWVVEHLHHIYEELSAAQAVHSLGRARSSRRLLKAGSNKSKGAVSSRSRQTHVSTDGRPSAATTDATTYTTATLHGGLVASGQPGSPRSDGLGAGTGQHAWVEQLLEPPRQQEPQCGCVGCTIS